MKFVSYLPAAADSAELFLTPRMSASPSLPISAVHVGNMISAQSSTATHSIDWQMQA